VRAVRYVVEARAEFLHEVSYFSTISSQIARRFDRAVLQAEAQAAEFPDMGSPYKHGTRRILLPERFKFSLVYMTFPDYILIVALAPFKRKPGYWKHRVAA
jgi:plasmid stabilization system protein ParE